MGLFDPASRCPDCNGSGNVRQRREISRPCGACGGSGRISGSSYDDPGRTCSRCSGRGTVSETRESLIRCPRCHGTGYLD
jgi:DnaJ-class molecular chaperone